MNPTIQTQEEFERLVAEKDGLIVYFSNNICGACDVLEDKIRALLQDRFPKMEMYMVYTTQSPEIAGQNRVFAAPTILIFFAGREQARFTRTVGISQIIQAIERPYSLIFDDATA